jgi:hypothetical protein
MHLVNTKLITARPLARGAQGPPRCDTRHDKKPRKPKKPQKAHHRAMIVLPTHTPTPPHGYLPKKQVSLRKVVPVAEKQAGANFVGPLAQGEPGEVSLYSLLACWLAVSV